MAYQTMQTQLSFCGRVRNVRCVANDLNFIFREVAMIAKCLACLKYWNVSIYKHLPKSGYICPCCEKKPPRELALHTAAKKNTSPLM